MSTVVVGGRRPHEPVELKRDLWDSVHASTPDWYETCILGIAPEKRHDMANVVDYFSTSMIAVDSDAGMAASFVTTTKECDAYVVRMPTSLVDLLRQAGRVELWSDTESAQLTLVNELTYCC